MLKLRKMQNDLWDSLLPAEWQTLPVELAKVDVLLNDDRFLQPFIAKCSTKRGRPTLPIASYLRLMYLKSRYQLGYESLIHEVGDSIAWRRFCGFSLTARLPDPTTLLKARKRYGEKIVEELNDLLLKKLQEEKILKTRKLRTDTTVVEVDIHHPTDATVLQDSIQVVTRWVGKIRKVASHATQGFIDRTAEVKQEILAIAKLLKRRTNQSWDEINAITRNVVAIAQDVCQSAQIVVEKLQNQSRQSRQSLQTQLANAVEVTQQLIGQAREVVSGNRKIPERIVSVFDTEARAIKKGKLGKTAEFGYKVRIDETDNGFVSGYEVYRGNPSDDQLLVAAVTQHQKKYGAVPQAVATDRGFASRANEEELQQLGVKRISSPLKGKKSKQRAEHEAQLWFKDLQRFRAGGEAKISLLKRKYGLNRSRYRGFAGTKTWVGLGILAHNLKRAAQVA